MFLQTEQLLFGSLLSTSTVLPYGEGAFDGLRACSWGRAVQGWWGVHITRTCAGNTLRSCGLDSAGLDLPELRPAGETLTSSSPSCLAPCCRKPVCAHSGIWVSLLRWQAQRRRGGLRALKQWPGGRQPAVRLVPGVASAETTAGRCWAGRIARPRV